MGQCGLAACCRCQRSRLSLQHVDLVGYGVGCVMEIHIRGRFGPSGDSWPLKDTDNGVLSVVPSIVAPYSHRCCCCLHGHDSDGGGASSLGV